jgi:hypothetical protein
MLACDEKFQVCRPFAVSGGLLILTDTALSGYLDKTHGLRTSCPTPKAPRYPY